MKITKTQLRSLITEALQDSRPAATLYSTLDNIIAQHPEAIKEFWDANGEGNLDSDLESKILNVYAYYDPEIGYSDTVSVIDAFWDYLSNNYNLDDEDSYEEPSGFANSRFIQDPRHPDRGDYY